MKIKEISHQTNYSFTLKFENNEVITSDLQNLIGNYVDLKNINTAKINPDWGCLEFINGKVDIEPKTLYRYAKNHVNIAK